MDFLKDRVVPFIKEHFAALVVGAVGLMFLVYGFVSLYYVQDTEEDIVFAAKEDPSTRQRRGSPQAASLREDQSEKELTTKMILVDIAGAVTKPGVYSLPAGSRVQDVLIAAGGVSQDADQPRIAQTLNLAAPLTDGAKLYIPAVGDQIAVSNPNGSAGSGASTSFASESLININAASSDELDTLPGVGEVTAEKIIANRPYGSIEELLEKKVVGAATFEKIREKISVY